MPIIPHSSYSSPWWLRGGHAQTILPVLFRRRNRLSYVRKILGAPDGDLFATDLARASQLGPAKGIAILSHGLEGDSRRKYMLGMARAFLSCGWDVAARNFRCCGGEENQLPGMYHAGQTEDLRVLVRFCQECGYKKIILAGFSMGGNQVLKYLGEEGENLPPEISGAAVFSVPCDLAGCARVLDARSNRIYMDYFLRSLRKKIRLKNVRYPEQYPLEGLEGIRTFSEFDQRYTAPVHGFASAQDYWSKASSLPYLPAIRVKTLLVNAGNDPFLARSCYPIREAQASNFIHLEVPAAGGHVGFGPAKKGGRYWSESRVLDFFQEELGLAGLQG